MPNSNEAGSPQLSSCLSEQRLHSKVEIAAFLGVTQRTVEAYQRLGLPFFKLGPRRNRYDLLAVRGWLESHCRRGAHRQHGSVESSLRSHFGLNRGLLRSDGPRGHQVNVAAGFGKTENQEFACASVINWR